MFALTAALDGVTQMASKFRGTIGGIRCALPPYGARFNPDLMDAYCGLTPADCATIFHLSISARTCAVNFSGDSPPGLPPMSSSR